MGVNPSDRVTMLEVYLKGRAEEYLHIEWIL
jgi:hypothetical protein